VKNTLDFTISWATLKDYKSKEIGGEFMTIVNDKSNAIHLYVWTKDEDVLNKKDNETIPSYRRMPGFVTVIIVDKIPPIGTKIRHNGIMWRITDIVISQCNQYDNSGHWNLVVTKDLGKEEFGLSNL
jgi:hypothetical protein